MPAPPGIPQGDSNRRGPLGIEKDKEVIVGWIWESGKLLPMIRDLFGLSGVIQDHLSLCIGIAADNDLLTPYDLHQGPFYRVMGIIIQKGQHQERF